MKTSTQRGLCRFFGIDQLPFSISPDPHFLYLGENHQEALAHLLYGVDNEGGFIVLSGEVGTGKTTLCRALLQQLPDTTDVAYVVNPRLSANDLLQTLCDELGLFYNAQERTGKVLFDVLTRYLLASHSRGRHSLLIIDEAQNLSTDVLEQIRLLTNLETDEKKLLQLVLIGQPELAETLARPELRQLAQRITARYHLPVLSRAETARYIEHRLTVAGHCGHLFSTVALREVYRVTRGTPRLINRLCERSMLGAYVGERRQVTRSIVASAARQMRVPERQSHLALKRRQQRPTLAWRPAALALGLLVGLCSAIYYAPLGLRYSGQLYAHWQQQWQPDVADVSRARLAGRQRQDLALRELAAIWGIDVAPGEAVCSSVARHRLYCLDVELTPAQIRQLALPGVVQLGGDIDREYRVLDTHSAISTLDAEQASRLTYSLLWREPPATASWPYRPGDEHDGLAWLRRRLAWWQGDRPLWLSTRDSGGAAHRVAGTAPYDWLLTQSPALARELPTSQYGPAVQRQVAALQRTLGWSATGVADLLTMIKLDALTNDAAPRLVSAG